MPSAHAYFAHICDTDEPTVKMANRSAVSVGKMCFNCNLVTDHTHSHDPLNDTDVYLISDFFIHWR